MSAVSPPHWSRCFGLLWQSDIKIEHFLDANSGEKAVDVAVYATTNLTARNPIHRINRGIVYTDGFRFKWDDTVTFDMFDGNRIEYCPGPKWTGVLPWPFHSTVAALLLAWRGSLPFHGSAVSIDGHGVMICGVSGAGKSSLTAALVAEGAHFISDDLSVVVADEDRSSWNLVRGRPGIRLFPTVGRWFFGDSPRPLSNDPRGKVIAVPAIGTDENPVPLCHVIFLGAAIRSMSAIDQYFLLQKNLFRPNWLSKLPDFVAMRIAVRDISTSAYISVEPVIGETDEQTLRQRATAIIALVRSKDIIAQ
jgi:hypothetical protein